MKSGARWSKAGFRVFSAVLTSAEIAQRLDLQPTRAHEAGDPVSSRRAEPLRKESVWILESGVPDTEAMAVHLARLLELLEPRVDRLAALASLCGMDFFCGYASASGQGGFILGGDLLTRLGRIPGGGLQLDLYPPPQDE